METRDWYSDYYERKGEDRNSLLRNSGVLYQMLARDASFITALRSIDLDINGCRILDVGCGAGGSIVDLIRLGIKPHNIFGIDILEERVLEARGRFPNVNWICCDARNTDFSNEEFDLVTESTMFTQITESNAALEIAEEMIRVTKKYGYIILTDWRYSSPMRPEYKGLSQKRIHRLFEVGTRTEVCCICGGALMPPVGRFLSSRCPYLYFTIAGIVPFLVAQQTTVLRRIF